MHASLILLATSLAASVVAAPLPTVLPVESPEPLMVREVQNPKREILERLDAIVRREVLADRDGAVNDELDDESGAENGALPSEKRGFIVPDILSNDKRGSYGSPRAGNDNDKRDISSRPMAEWDTPDNTIKPGQKAWGKKRNDGSDPASHDKRGVDFEYNASTNDEIDASDRPRYGYNPNQP